MANTVRPELPQPGAELPNNVTKVFVRQTARPEAALRGVEMMTVPLADIGATDLAEILGIASGELHAATYDPEFGDYVVYPNFALPSDSAGSSDPIGLGMWVRFPEAWQKSVIDSPVLPANPFTAELKQAGTGRQSLPRAAELVALGHHRQRRHRHADPRGRRRPPANPAVEDYAWTWNSSEARTGSSMTSPSRSFRERREVPVWSAFWVKATGTAA